MHRFLHSSIAMKKRVSKSIKVLIGLLGVLVILRAVLPTGLQWYINRQLAQMKEYNGHVGDVDVALIRGAYSIEDVEILKANGKVPVPFFAAKEIEFSVQWKALTQGTIVAEIEVASPQLNFVDGPTPERSQKKIDSNWRKMVDELVPLQINRFAIRNGEVHFRNLASKPPVDLHIKKLAIDAHNLSNSADKNAILPSTINARGIVMGKAPFHVDVKLNALKDPIDFDLNSELKDLTLSDLNDFFKEYASIDIESGTLTIASEMAAKDGALVGYIKPIFTSLDVVELDKDAEKGPFALFWQSLTGTLADVLQNDDKQGTRIPIKGSLKKPRPDIFAAIKSSVKHALGEELNPGLEKSVNINSTRQRAPSSKRK